MLVSRRGDRLLAIGGGGAGQCISRIANVSGKNGRPARFLWRHQIMTRTMIKRMKKIEPRVNPKYTSTMLGRCAGGLHFARLLPFELRGKKAGEMNSAQWQRGLDLERRLDSCEE